MEFITKSMEIIEVIIIIKSDKLLFQSDWLKMINLFHFLLNFCWIFLCKYLIFAYNPAISPIDILKYWTSNSIILSSFNIFLEYLFSLKIISLNSLSLRFFKRRWFAIIFLAEYSIRNTLNLYFCFNI